MGWKIVANTKKNLELRRVAGSGTFEVEFNGNMILVNFVRSDYAVLMLICLDFVSVENHLLLFVGW